MNYTAKEWGMFKFSCSCVAYLIFVSCELSDELFIRGISSILVSNQREDLWISSLYASCEDVVDNLTV